MADGSDGMASTHGPASPGHEARHPVPSSRVPGRRSRLRVLDVETGRATVVHESSELLLESVSWPDGGETLIVSAGGAQWGIPVGGGEPQRLGPAPADPVDGATGAAGGGRDEVVLTRVGACRLADGTWIPRGSSASPAPEGSRPLRPTTVALPERPLIRRAPRTAAAGPSSTRRATPPRRDIRSCSACDPTAPGSSSSPTTSA